MSLPSAAVLRAEDLAGAQILDRGRGLVRIESRHRYLSSVAEIRWDDVTAAGSALLADGRTAILLWGLFLDSVAEVMTLPTMTGPDRMSAGDSAAFTVMFGRTLATRVVRGDVQIPEGDLAWLDDRLNPSSPHYFRAS